MSNGDKPTVLVVEDESPLVEIYSRWLEDRYEVRTAESGEEAREELDGDIEVILLDRLMPGLSGDEVLEEVREHTSGCKVAMVTAVEPDFDIITMGFDDYLTKPVDREELLSTVERLLSRTAFASLEREYHALISKRAALESAKSREELAESEEYQELTERIVALEADIVDTAADLDDGGFVAMVRDIEHGEGSGDREDV
jgi:DNA-binding response OmpR family regulator